MAKKRSQSAAGEAIAPPQSSDHVQSGHDQRIKLTLAARMQALFKGLERAHGTYRIEVASGNGTVKVEGKALTVKEPPTVEVWQRHLDGKVGVGIVPINDEGMCYFAAIDIDKYPLNLADLEKVCSSESLPVVPCRTKSGGAHLYLFMKEPIEAAYIRELCEKWAIDIGYGGCEIFPKQSKQGADTTGNWINMPYFATLTGKTNRYAIHKGEELSIEQFLDRAERLRVTRKQLDKLAVDRMKKGNEESPFKEGPPCLQAMSVKGFPEGVRNNGLFAVGVYLKKRYAEGGWQDAIREYNKTLFKPPLSDQEVANTIKSLNRKEYNYSCNKSPCKDFCDRAVCHTRQWGVGPDEEISWDLSIDYDTVIRVLTDPPYWIVSINSNQINLRVEDLMSQREFIARCMEKNILQPPMLKAPRWREEGNKIMSAAKDVEAPADASLEGELKFFLQQFCTNGPQADTKGEILTGKPFHEKGWVYFRSTDFRRYLDSQHFRVSRFDLYTSMRKLGVDHQQYWTGEQNIQVWKVKDFEGKLETVPAKQLNEGGM